MLQKYRYHIYILLAGLSYSSLAVFSALLTQQQVDAFSQVFWRLVLGVFFVFIIVKIIFKQRLQFNKSELRYLLVNSLFFLFGYTTFSGSIYLGTPIAKAIALNYAYPITVVVLSYLLFKEVPTKRNWIAIVLSLISIPVLLEVWQIKDLTRVSPGELLAWANSFFFAAIIVWGTKIRKDTSLKPFATLFYSMIFVIPEFLVFSLVLEAGGVSLFAPVLRLDFDITSWLVLIGLGSLGSVVPLSLIYFGVSKLKPFVTSVLLLTEPVWVYIFGLILFGQSLSFWGMLGAIGIIVSVLFT